MLKGVFVGIYWFYKMRFYWIYNEFKLKKKKDNIEFFILNIINGIGSKNNCYLIIEMRILMYKCLIEDNDIGYWKCFMVVGNIW